MMTDSASGGLSADAQAMMAFESSKKSQGVAYLLWLFLGGFGGHRFYLGRTGSAVFQLILGVLGWMTIWVGVGLIFFFPLGIWLIVDLFLIPGIAQEHNTKLVSQLNGQARPASLSAVDELARFAALRDQGAISEDEYEAQKRRLIGPAPTPTPTPAAAGEA